MKRVELTAFSKGDYFILLIIRLRLNGKEKNLKTPLLFTFLTRCFITILIRVVKHLPF